MLGSLYNSFLVWDYISSTKVSNLVLDGQLLIPIRIRFWDHISSVLNLILDGQLLIHYLKQFKEQILKEVLNLILDGQLLILFITKRCLCNGRKIVLNLILDGQLLIRAVFEYKNEKEFALF